ncbi:SIMPL domain-containing protein [Patescibacteria group bacterium]
MNEKIKNALGISIIATLAMTIIILIAGVWAINQTVNPSEGRMFSVNAEGEVQTTPDVANFSFSVITEGGLDVTTLQQENTKKMNAIITSVKARGADTEDIKTTNYSVSPRYTQYYRCDEAPCPPREIVGYTVTQNVAVKVRDFATIGALLTDITESGANNVYGPDFAIDDLTQAQNDAREVAIAKAKEKAEQMAKAGGFRLGKLISISEGGGYYPQYERTFMAMDVAEGKGGGVAAPAIEPGSQDVKVNITLTFEIK